MQTDAAVGRIVQAIDGRGLKENTIVIVTSDNGCSVVAMRLRLEKHGHYPNGPYRGAKGSLWDGVHRVPFLVGWPDVVEAGSTSDELICFTDVLATFADLTGCDVPEDEGEDSVSFLPSLKGKQIRTERRGIIHHGSNGHFAHREGRWKLILHKDSGGWIVPQEARAPKSSPKAQLYDMKADPAESNNLYEEYPEVAARLLKRLTDYVNAGRSTDGPDASNDVEEIILWK